MKYALLPTPRDVELSPDTRVAVGSASPVTTAPEVDDGLRRGLEDWLRARGDGRLPVVVTRDAGLGPEASRLCVTEQAVELTASDAVGWRHALDRLRQLGGPYGELPLGRIADAPALAMRGFHLNFNIPTLDFEAGKRVLESMARWRLNTVLLEYDRRYPYDAHGAIAAPDALTRPEVRALVDHARALGIEPIPLQQCLGHVNYILRHEAYARLREEQEHQDQFCPLNPASFALFEELVDDVIDLHPGIRYFHIGGDETRRLGACPRCAAVAARQGKGRLYVDYVCRAIALVRARGLTPIIWDDMLCAHPEVIAQMPREAVIMYWDYWTTRDPSALFVARPQAGTGVVADTGWSDRWQHELSETERRTVRHFARPLDLARTLTPAFMERFGRYLGPGFPKRIRAFPFLEHYQELGFRVIGAPTGCGNTSTWRQLPDFPRYGENIHAFSRRIRAAGGLGIVTSAWYPVPPEALMPGILFTGQFTWNPDVPPEA